jgi:predicted N-formylglutamate amidohydrolase
MVEERTYNSHQYGDAPYFVFCDHASNFIPKEFNCLGVSYDVLQTHIAWDPGSSDLTHAIAAKLDGTAFLSKFSRLLIDPNRSSDREDLVTEFSDQIPIPGNKGLSYEQRCTRIKEFFEPYHEGLDNELAKVEERGEALFVVSVHSYTPRLMGEFEDRPWHIGVLWRHDEQTARSMISDLRTETDFQIGDNEPYDAREFNYSVDRHIAPRRLRHLTLEIRQDLLVTSDQVEEMADCLTTSIRRF